MEDGRNFLCFSFFRFPLSHFKFYNGDPLCSGFNSLWNTLPFKFWIAMENARFLGLLEPWEHIVNKIFGRSRHY